jgi:tetratricopeptide (TPR) repeat protein
MWQTAPIALAMLLCGLLLASCFKKHPINENALLHQRACIEAIEVKDHQRANIHCELCLEYESSMPECLNGIGLIALTNNDEEKARVFFTKALRQNNDYSQARNNLGVIHFSHGDFLSALKYFDRALEIDPSNTDARYNAGLSHFRLAQRMRAGAQTKTSIHYLHNAKNQINKLLAIEPTYHSAFRDLGLIELNLYDLTEFVAPRQELLISAQNAFLKCLEIASDDDGCYEGLAQVYLEQGRFDKSFANYFLCLTYAPENSACRNGIVVAYEKSAHTDGGYQTLSKNMQHDAGNALAHEAFCGALFERGLDKEAVKECELALRLKPDLCSVQFKLADYFTGVINAERAVMHCQAFLSCGSKVSSREIKRCQEILATVRR